MELDGVGLHIDTKFLDYELMNLIFYLVFG